MAKSTDDEHEHYKYLSYVTLKEAWREVKGSFIVWIVFSIGSAITGLFIDFGVSNTESFWPNLPKPVWFVLGFAAISWLARGEEIHFSFPKSFKLWLFMTCSMALIVFAATMLSTWATVSVYFGVLIVANAVDSLALIGEKNFLKLSEEQDNDV